MPRSASDRKFGFKSKGLIRILTSADIDEVRKALAALSFSPFGADIGQAIKNLIKAPFELLGGLLDLVFENVIPLSEDLVAQIKNLDQAITLIEQLGLRDLNFAGRKRGRDREALTIMRRMRSALAAEVIRQKKFFDEIDAFKRTGEALEETQETSLNAILDTTEVA